MDVWETLWDICVLSRLLFLSCMIDFILFCHSEWNCKSYTQCSDFEMFLSVLNSISKEKRNNIFSSSWFEHVILNTLQETAWNATHDRALFIYTCDAFTVSMWPSDLSDGLLPAMLTLIGVSLEATARSASKDGRGRRKDNMRCLFRRNHKL